MWLPKISLFWQFHTTLHIVWLITWQITWLVCYWSWVYIAMINAYIRAHIGTGEEILPNPCKQCLFGEANSGERWPFVTHCVSPSISRVLSPTLLATPPQTGWGLSANPWELPPTLSSPSVCYLTSCTVYSCICYFTSYATYTCMCCLTPCTQLLHVVRVCLHVW